MLKINYLSSLLKSKSGFINPSFCYQVSKEIRLDKPNLIQSIDTNPSEAICYLISSFLFTNNYSPIVFSADPKYFIGLFQSCIIDLLVLNNLELDDFDIKTNNTEITIKFEGRVNTIFFCKKISNSIDKLKVNSFYNFVYVDNVDFTNNAEVKNLLLITNEINDFKKINRSYIVTTTNKEEIIDSAFETRKDLFKLIKIK